MEEKLFLVKFETTPANSNIVNHVDVRQVYAKTPKEATTTVFNILSVMHPEYGSLRCSIVEPQAPKTEEPVPAEAETEKAE